MFALKSTYLKEKKGRPKRNANEIQAENKKVRGKQNKFLALRVEY